MAPRPLSSSRALGGWPLAGGVPSPNMASLRVACSCVSCFVSFLAHTLTCVVALLLLFFGTLFRRYHRLYLATKGNKYKTKKQLMEAVHKMKAEKAAEKALKDLAEQKKARAKAARARKEAKARAAE